MSVIDASVYISVLKPDEPDHADCLSWFRTVVENDHVISAPVIILAEVAAGIRRGVGDREFAERAIAGLLDSQIVRLRAVSMELGIRAASIAATHGVRGCDAVYLALAESLGEPLVTLDRQQFERGAAVVTVIRPGL